MTDDGERLHHILEAIEKIEKYQNQVQSGADNELVMVWLLHHLQIIGEAAAKVSKDFQSAHSEIPWTKIIGMRNILVHHYFELEASEILSTIQKDIPKLKLQVRAIVNDGKF